MNYQSDFQRMGQGKKRETARDTTWVGQSKLYFVFLFVKQTCELMGSNVWLKRQRVPICAIFDYIGIIASCYLYVNSTVYSVVT